jgi:hypothetical protein
MSVIFLVFAQVIKEFKIKLRELDEDNLQNLKFFLYFSAVDAAFLLFLNFCSSKNTTTEKLLGWLR